MLIDALALPILTATALPARPSYEQCYGDAVCCQKLKARDVARPSFEQCHGDAACDQKLTARAAPADGASAGAEFPPGPYKNAKAPSFDPHPEPPNKRAEAVSDATSPIPEENRNSYLSAAASAN